MLSLLVHELRSRWKGIVGWSIGLTLFGAMYISVWPQAEEQMSSLADLSLYKAMGISLGSFEGYMASVVVMFLPLLLGIYAIVTATKTLAGEEDDGTLELIMARPLHRWQVVVAKTLAIAIATIVILVAAGLGDAAVLAGVKIGYETTVMPIDMLRALVSAWPIVMAFAAISLFLAAVLPSRRGASIVATFILIASYFGENVAGLVSSLDFIKPASLFAYFDTTAAVFSEGAATSDTLILLGVAVVFFLLTLLVFQQRNISVGAWAWQRGRVPAGYASDQSRGPSES